MPVSGFASSIATGAIFALIAVICGARAAIVMMVAGVGVGLHVAGVLLYVAFGRRRPKPHD